MQHVEKEKEQISEDSFLYQKYASRLFAHIYPLVSSQQDAEDVLLEVFIAAFKADNLQDIPVEKQLAWLQMVARNKTIDLYRRKMRAPLLPLEYAYDIIDDKLTPEQRSIQREGFEQLYHVIAELPLLQQQIIHLRFGNGLRFAQIAMILDKHEGSVRALLSRTLRHLRKTYLETERR